MVLKVKQLAKDKAIRIGQNFENCAIIAIFMGILLDSDERIRLMKQIVM